MVKKEQIKECIKCSNYDGKNCSKNDNIGIVIEYRQEKPIFLKTPDEINKEKNCKDYAELSEK